jgi:osmotically-inducible protein OsmY
MEFAGSATRLKVRSRTVRTPLAARRTFLMKTDAQLKADILAELSWDPSMPANAIGVAIERGMVTLTGHLDSLADKHAVEQAVQRVSGVRGIAVELDVTPPREQRHGDSDIAKAALAALRWHVWVPEQRLKVEVEDGWVALTGEVDWHYQAAAAEECVRSLTGVRGLTTSITVKPRADEQDITSQISAALTRHACREAGRIGIEVDGGVVTLKGKVHSLPEHEAALGAAWATRGVSRVVDKLQVTG